LFDIHQNQVLGVADRLESLDGAGLTDQDYGMVVVHHRCR
jgi:hypothetical protein